MSSTWRGLRTIQLALDSFSGIFVSKNVLWHTDNLNYVQIVQKGSTKSHLQSLAFGIYAMCWVFN